MWTRTTRREKSSAPRRRVRILEHARRENACTTVEKSGRLPAPRKLHRRISAGLLSPLRLVLGYHRFEAPPGLKARIISTYAEAAALPRLSKATRNCPLAEDYCPARRKDRSPGAAVKGERPSLSPGELLDSTSAFVEIATRKTGGRTAPLRSTVRVFFRSEYVSRSQSC